ncbi:uncharacterized protein LOC134717689 [Mytilus trossulus]|uniref:uncharacterized protein LOC134717689 n=1 Tax=Mytilus trossulus TaxID=6551 RepID=UPI00300506E3
MDLKEKSVTNQSNIKSPRDEDSPNQEINVACTDKSHSESIEFVKSTSNESPANVAPPYMSEINVPPRNAYPSYVVDSSEMMRNVSGTQHNTDSSSESEKHISKSLPINHSGTKSEHPNYSTSVRSAVPESQVPNFTENSNGSYIPEPEKPMSNPPPFSNMGSIEPTSEILVQKSISECSNASNKLFIDLSEEAQSSKTLNTKKKLTKIHLPRIRSMMKKDPEVRLVSKEAVVVLAKATELFIEELCKDAMKNTLQGTTKRKTLQRKDLGLMLRTLPVLAVPEVTEEKTGEGSSPVSTFGPGKPTNAETVTDIASSKAQQYDIEVAIPFSKEQQCAEPVIAISVGDESVKTTKTFKDLQTDYESDNDMPAVGKQLQPERNWTLKNDLKSNVESLRASPFLTTAMSFSKDLQSDFSPILACNKELQTDVATDMTKPFFGELQYDADSLMAEPFSTEFLWEAESVKSFPSNKTLQNDSE